MLKFIKHHMTAGEGIEAFPVAAFVIFFVFFSLMIVYVFTMQRKHVDAMSNIPLTDEPVEHRNTSKSPKP